MIKRILLCLTIGHVPTALAQEQLARSAVQGCQFWVANHFFDLGKLNQYAVQTSRFSEPVFQVNFKVQPGQQPIQTIAYTFCKPFDWLALGADSNDVMAVTFIDIAYSEQANTSVNLSGEGVSSFEIGVSLINEDGLTGVQLEYFTPGSWLTYLTKDTTDLDLQSSLKIQVLCDDSVTTGIVYKGDPILSNYPSNPQAIITIYSSAGCPIFQSKDPYWFAKMANQQWVGWLCALVCICIGLWMTFFGKVGWKGVHLLTGFFMPLTFFLLILFTPYKKKGFIPWYTMACYPVVTVISFVMSRIMPSFPKEATILLAGWAGWAVGTNLLGNLVVIPCTQSMPLFWIVSITTTVVCMLLSCIPLRQPHTHLVWVSPIVGSYLCVLGVFMVLKNMPLSYNYANIYVKMEGLLMRQNAYIYTFESQVLLIILGIVVQFLVEISARSKARKEANRRFASDFVKNSETSPFSPVQKARSNEQFTQVQNEAEDMYNHEKQLQDEERLEKEKGVQNLDEESSESQKERLL